MAPSRGISSNSKSQDLTEQRKNLKQLLETSKDGYSHDIEELFNTLAEWNDYLENHVPHFKKPQEPER